MTSAGNGEGATPSASVLCASKRKNSRSTAALGSGARASPAPVLRHEEQHLADAAETVSQRREGEER